MRAGPCHCCRCLGLAEDLKGRLNQENPVCCVGDPVCGGVSLYIDQGSGKQDC